MCASVLYRYLVCRHCNTGHAAALAAYNQIYIYIYIIILSVKPVAAEVCFGGDERGGGRSNSRRVWWELAGRGVEDTGNARLSQYDDDDDNTPSTGSYK